MGFLFGGPKPPAPPPPPPAAPSVGTASIQEAAAAERQRIASAQGQGSDGTDVTGGQGVKTPASTTANAVQAGATATKSVLGG